MELYDSLTNEMNNLMSWDGIDKDSLDTLSPLNMVNWMSNSGFPVSNPFEDSNQLFEDMVIDNQMIFRASSNTFNVNLEMSLSLTKRNSLILPPNGSIRLPEDQGIMLDWEPAAVEADVTVSSSNEDPSDHYSIIASSTSYLSLSEDIGSEVMQVVEDTPRMTSENSENETALQLESDNSSDGYISSRALPKRWSYEECSRLREAVKKLGSPMRWNEVANYVGNRSVSQCINKWKNDISKGEKRPRWTAAAGKRLEQYLNLGLTYKEIQRQMPEYTYIQIYQQTQKHQSNMEPWQPWEFELLGSLKRSGVLSDTEIGRRLNNRHRDAVKNEWNHMKRERNLE